MNHWDEYWATSNAVHSFSEGTYQKGYDGEVAQLWNGIFNSLPSRAKCLDIGSGNGGLALLAVSHQNAFTVHACDAANINPLQTLDIKQSHYQALTKVTFHANMKAEDLDFSNAHFDFAMSQFGIEYSNMQQSIAEVARVLNPTGRFVAMLHHKNSFVTTNTIAGIKLMSVFFRKGGIIESLGNFVEFYNSEAFKNNQNKHEAMQVFKSQNTALLHAFQSLQQKYASGHHNEWFTDISKMLVPFVMSWQQCSIEDYDKTLSTLIHFNDRLKEQVQSAKNQADINILKDWCSHYFSSFTCKPVRLKEGLFAWQLDITK